MVMDAFWARIHRRLAGLAGATFHRRALAPVLVAVLVGSTAPADLLSAQALQLDRLEAVADSLARARSADQTSPGFSVAVARDGEVILARGYGLADVELDVAASPATVYRIGSLTKQFTAAAIMRLVEAGELALDDPITDFLPDYPTQGHTVTVRHLLNHTSGIVSYTGLHESRWERDYRMDLSHDELIEIFAGLPYDFEPGAEYRYNNSAYYLLGVIIEAVTGAPFPEYVERELFRPLGLDDTYYCDVRRIIPDRAEGYEYDDDTLVNAPFLSMNVPGAAGALCSTVGDLIDWTRLLHTGGVVSAGSLRQMTTPTPLASGDTAPYGFGLALDELEGHRKIAHGGGIQGFTSYLSHYPDDALTVAVLTNAGSGGPGQVEEILARTALGLELPSVVDLPLDADDSARYEGTYLLSLGEQTLELRVFVDDGRLMAQAEGQGANRLRYQGDHEFVPTFDDNVRLVFTVENGRAASVTLHQGGAVVTGERQEP